jgi:nucleoside-diphosphate-sugar epimerase
MDPESIFSPIPPYVSAVLRGETPTPLPADAGGDWCYAPDMGRAIASLVSAGTLNHTTYNVSSGKPFVYGEAAGQLAVEPGGETSPHLDITRLTEETGFTPTFTFPEAVAHYITWRTNNPR